MPLAIIQFFEREFEALERNPDRLMTRYRLHYGDTISGRAWDENDEGFIVLSAGDSPVPIAVANHTDTDGKAILMSSIVKIESARSKRVIYRHPRFHTHEEDAPRVESSATSRAPRRISLTRARNRQ